ncbi:hypothetical protein ACSQ67_022576 [Phaseolus vulgaris]
MAVEIIEQTVAVDERRLKREPSDGVPNAWHVCACGSFGYFSSHGAFSHRLPGTCSERVKTQRAYPAELTERK